jgi:predicted metal-dependent enzyme (double-stranded beta helix superfamily)
MSINATRFPLRECASKLVSAFEIYAGEHDKLSDAIKDATRPLLERADLESLGVKRQGNFVNNSKFLYYDGGLEMTLNEMPPGKQFPAHDHGTCEAIVIYAGQLAHTVYERVDNGSRQGHADLKVIDDRVLQRGDITLMMPPVEIHSFKAVTPGTFVLTVVQGRIKADRHFYRPEDGTYTIGTPQMAMEGRSG